MSVMRTMSIEFRRQLYASVVNDQKLSHTVLGDTLSNAIKLVRSDTKDQDISQEHTKRRGALLPQSPLQYRQQPRED